MKKREDNKKRKGSKERKDKIGDKMNQEQERDIICAVK